MLHKLKKRFYEEVFPSLPNDWEVEEVLENLLELPPEQSGLLLSRIKVVWPVSHSLGFSYLEYGARHIGRFTEDDLDEWIRQFLSSYESQGLTAARTYMLDVENHYFAKLKGAGGVQLADIRLKLQAFIRGVSASPLEVGTGSIPWTDSATIFLPDRIHYFSGEDENRLMYTFLACVQWGYLVFDTFGEAWEMIHPESSEDELIMNGFPEPQLAVNIYHFLKFSSVLTMLESELPGMMRKVKPLLHTFFDQLHLRWRENSDQQGFFYHKLKRLLDQPSRSQAGRAVETRRRDLAQLYEEVAGGAGGDDWSIYNPVAGLLQFDKVRERIRLKRAEEKNMFVKKMAVLIAEAATERGDEPQEHQPEGSAPGEDGQLLAVLSEGEGDRERMHTLKVNSNEVELPPEMSELISRITKDLGHIPSGYMQAASGIAGRAIQRGEGVADSGDEIPETGGEAVLYDEWDFRRQGYRKNWCAVITKDVQPVRSQFIEDTISKYSGLMVRLRRQFEMLRTTNRFARRRRFGDDIDFDALVDAVGDRQAGIVPSDRLFIRLLRDQRDIAVMFLVDMSNSTEGWIGKAIKESLVLLCDVLEIVGDRYAIYGFSGMRRSKCELYRIKLFDEPYGELVQQRVCAISPREYTRMAPPVRHLTGELLKVDARVRLLLTISDGKPEDYDDYRGDYAIEDTRQALIEARGKGVIPFCITVDREAHSYLSHMFGENHYIYVDSVEKLPARIPEVYRHITR